MTARDYRFRSEWVLRGPTVGEVYDALVDVEHYPTWWRSIPAVGKLDDDTALVACRSRVPTTLHLVLRPQVRDRDAGILEAELAGDLVGWSRFTLSPHHEGVHISYDQEVDTPGWLMTLAGKVARSLLVWNHEQMMLALRDDLAIRLASRSSDGPLSASGR